jgi:hypothetical protein
MKSRSGFRTQGRGYPCGTGQTDIGVGNKQFNEIGTRLV